VGVDDAGVERCGVSVSWEAAVVLKNSGESASPTDVPDLMVLEFFPRQEPDWAAFIEDLRRQVDEIFGVRRLRRLMEERHVERIG